MLEFVNSITGSYEVLVTVSPISHKSYRVTRHPP